MKPYAVRRFAIGRQDRQNFELYDTRTGECASFPGTKRDLTRYARQKNAEYCAKGYFMDKTLTPDSFTIKNGAEK